MSEVRVMDRIIGPAAILHYDIALMAYVLSLGPILHLAAYIVT